MSGVHVVSWCILHLDFIWECDSDEPSRTRCISPYEFSIFVYYGGFLTISVIINRGGLIVFGCVSGLISLISSAEDVGVNLCRFVFLGCCCCCF